MAPAYVAVPPLPVKYDRVYKARARNGDAVYDVNLARLECTCPDWTSNRASLSGDDVRRVCEHIYDKLYATKAEREWPPLAQLFIRYGRSMLTYRYVTDDVGVFAIGQPFGPRSIRAIGVVDGRALLATYDLDAECWYDGESELTPQLAKALLVRLRAAIA